MKFGICVGNLEEAAVVKQLGYDYFEFPFTKFADMSDEDFEAFKKGVQELDFYPEAMNLMLPGRFQITGDQADLGPVLPFVERGFARGAQVGLKTVVFGSGGARNLPQGFTNYKKAYQQIEDYLRLAGEIAAKYGATISIEPLRFEESNIINLVSEGAYMAARVNHPAVRCLADYYHIVSNKEDPESIPGFAHRLEHCHIARLEGRAYPLPEDEQSYQPFFDALKKAGYTKRVSVEGTCYNGMEKDGAASLALMKALAK